MSYHLYSKQFMKCPFCEDGEVPANLAGKTPPLNERTACRDCGVRMSLIINEAGEFKVEKDTTSKVPAYVLLQFDTELTKDPIYVVIESDYLYDTKDSKEDRDRSNRYYVEEHTCPTNLLGGMQTFFGVKNKHHPHLELIDTDPHGLLRYVAIATKEEVHSAITYEDLSNLQSHETAQILNYLLTLK